MNEPSTVQKHEQIEVTQHDWHPHYSLFSILFQ